MEIALSAEIPNYAGGLGVLSADILKSCADLGTKAAGVSLIYHQSDDPIKAFQAEKFMKKRKETIEVHIENRLVKVGVYQYDIKGEKGHKVPIFFLTTNLPENPRWDRDLTKNLYASEGYTRLGQEAILGIGGYKMLKALGYETRKHHLNEGHAALLTLECLHDHSYQDEAVKKHVTFTTHTPIPAGHDHFDYDISHKVLGKSLPWHIKKIATEKNLSMTDLALNLSGKSNSVSVRHREVCEAMFPHHHFENITNGVHHPSWISTAFKKLFDKHFPGWTQKPSMLQLAPEKLKNKDVLVAHKKNKKDYIKWLNSHPEFFCFHEDFQKDDLFDEQTLTISFARRFVPYKRPELIFKDLDRLRKIGYKKLQLVFAGNCHPDDAYCNNTKADIKYYAHRLRGQIKIAVIPSYSLNFSKLMVSGSDLWLNNPEKPMEASGTSGMKAALNGVLNLSILDGWWIEGMKQNPLSGFSIGSMEDLYKTTNDTADAHALYEALIQALDCYENNQSEWAERMKAAISLLSFFNTHRCIEEYQKKIWS